MEYLEQDGFGRTMWRSGSQSSHQKRLSRQPGHICWFLVVCAHDPFFPRIAGHGIAPTVVASLCVICLVRRQLSSTATISRIEMVADMLQTVWRTMAFV